MTVILPLLAMILLLVGWALYMRRQNDLTTLFIMEKMNVLILTIKKTIPLFDKFAESMDVCSKSMEEANVVWSSKVGETENKLTVDDAHNMFHLKDHF